MYRESYFCTKMNRVAVLFMDRGGGDSAIDLPKDTIFRYGEGAIFGVGRVGVVLWGRGSYFWTR